MISTVGPILKGMSLLHGVGNILNAFIGSAYGGCAIQEMRRIGWYW